LCRIYSGAGIYRVLIGHPFPVTGSSETCAMVSKCHNSQCAAEFRYFGDGKLFEFPPDSAGESSELFWLCENCYQAHTLERGQDGEVRLVAKRKHKPSSLPFGRAS
jgi:hypothetical protein